MPTASSAARPMKTAAIATRVRGLHAVVLAGLRFVTGLPAAPGLEPAEEQDQQHDRVGEHERGHHEQPEPDDPHPGRQRGHRPAAVQRKDGEQVEEVEEEADERERLEQLVAGQRVDPERHESRKRPEHRAGQADARLGRGVLRHLLHRHQGAQERDEHRRAGRDPLPAQLDHVPHLVHEQKQHEPNGELPAPDQRVGADRHEHRRRGGEQLELRQQKQERLELGRELDEHQTHRGERPQPTPPPGRALDRLGLVRRRVVGRRLARGDPAAGLLRSRFHLAQLWQRPLNWRQIRGRTSFDVELLRLDVASRGSGLAS